MARYARVHLKCAFIASFLTMGYSLISFNRFAPITEGWFTEYATLIHKGAFPYRDFYFFLPPAYLVGISAFTAVFGTHLIMLRIAGVVLMGLLGAGIYMVLSFSFRPWIAVCTTIATMVYYQTGNAHISYDFVQVMNTLTVWAIFCLQKVSTTKPSAWANHRIAQWSFLAGVLCSLAAMTKHSNGSIITIFCALASFYAGSVWSPQEGLRSALKFALGCAFIVLSFGLWLFANNALGPFFQQVIFGAISTKGNLSIILFQFAREFFGIQYWSFFARVLLLAWIPLVWACWMRKRDLEGDRDEHEISKCVWASAFFAAIFYLSWKWPLLISPRLTNSTDGISLSLIRLGVAAPVFVVACILLSSTKPVSSHAALIVSAIVILGMIWGNGTSAGLSETGVFLGVALLIALLLNLSGPFRIVSLLAFCVVGLQVTSWAMLKYSRPYSWWGVNQMDLRATKVSTSLPLLRGIYSDPQTMHVFEAVTASIRKNSATGSRILVFPHTPIFYTLSERKLMGKAVVDWFDFLPDNYALQEASILATDPPQVVVWLDMPEIVWTEHERLFRGGHLSEQRSIRRALQHLVLSGRMVEVEEIPVEPGFTFRIYRLNPTDNQLNTSGLSRPIGVTGLTAIQ
jgi:hypothetical protein